MSFVTILKSLVRYLGHIGLNDAFSIDWKIVFSNVE